MNKWKTKFRDLMMFLLGVIFTTCVTVLAETCQTTLSSSNVTYDNTTVQAETTELITQAGNIDTRVTNLESYFQNSPTSRFTSNDLHVGYNTTNGSSGIYVYGSNNVIRGGLEYYSVSDTTSLQSMDSSGSYGKGKLVLNGKPITLNATSGGTGDINLNGNIKVNNVALSESGTYYPTIINGGDSITFDCPINYYRFGNIVYLSHAFWSVSITNPTSTQLLISLPFPALTSNNYRFIGNFGYNNSGKNYFPVIAGNALAFPIKNTSGVITEVKGNEVRSFTGQWSIVYITNVF